MSAMDKVMGWFKGAKDKGTNLASDAKDRGQEMTGKAQDMASNAMEEVKEHVPGQGGGGTDSPAQ